MKAKEFFKQVARAEKELSRLKIRMQHYEDLGLMIASNIGGIGGKRRGASRTETAAVGILDSALELQKQIQEYNRIISRAEHVISEVKQDKYRKILDWHYLCGKTLSWISDELGYENKDSVYRAHGWALNEAQKIMNREGKQNERISEN
jgi:hypothetical protein